MFSARLILRSATRLRVSLFSRQTILTAGLLTCTAIWTPTAAQAQSTSRGRYYPLDQATAPGVAGRWATVQRGYQPIMQPVRVDLAGVEGQVSFFTRDDVRGTPLPAPAIVGLQVGATYRLKISNLAGFPGVELYPTVEMLDRLHPPRGREIEFAVPITLTVDEITEALEGRLVTKVIYLEQPDRAAPLRNSTADRTRLISPRENVLAIADEAGRPMVIVRLGERLPDAAAPEPGFYGTGAPIVFFEQPTPIQPPAPSLEAVQR